MQITHDTTTFAAALQQQIGLLDLFLHTEQQLQGAIIHKDWEQLETVLNKLQELSENINRCEQTRHDEFVELRKRLGLSDGARFSAVLDCLPSRQRISIASLYRRLKIAVLRVQAYTRGVDTYLHSSVETMQQILQEIFPADAGAVYAKDGSLRGKQPPAMVINQHL